MDIEQLKVFLKAFQRITAPRHPYSEQQLQDFGTRFYQLYHFKKEHKLPDHLSPSPENLAQFKAEFESFGIEFLHQFQKMVATGSTMNLWKFADLGRNEVQNCSVLAWLLREFGDHGLGKQFLLKLLSLNSELDEIRASLSRESYSVQLEYCVYGEISERIDIAIESKNTCLFIEAKIDAMEMYDKQSNTTQLERYHHRLHRQKPQQAAHKKIIFLTRNRQPALSEKLRQEIIALSWKDISSCLKKLDYASDYQRIVFTQLARHFETL